jgi:hypothetical protein
VTRHAPILPGSVVSARPIVVIVPRAKGRPVNAQATSRQRPRARPTPDRFVQVPMELVDDPRLEPIDVIVWIWIVRQPEVWKSPAPLSLQSCADAIGRTERNVRYSVARLQAANHLTVRGPKNTARTYSSPWLNIHKMARRMMAGNE